jgi:hypothetical protein
MKMLDPKGVITIKAD